MAGKYRNRHAFKDLLPESLYWMNFKDINSFTNIPKNEKWYEEYVQSRDYTVGCLNRDFWKEYLDFDVIDAWMKEGKPVSTEERERNNNYLYHLSYYCGIQQFVEKVHGELEIKL